MRLKEALTAVALGVGFVGLGLVLSRLKKKRKGKKRKNKFAKTPTTAPKNDLIELVSSVGGSSKHAIRFEDLVKLGN